MPQHVRIALVTGAARGIGAAVARRFAKEGYKVHLADVLDCAPVAQEIGNATVHTLDVRDAAACEALVQTIIDTDGRLDVLVCNAGICPEGEVVSSLEQWQSVLDVNLNGTRHCVAAAWPVMKAQEEGHIVLVSSMAFYQGGVVVGTEYTASKAALIGMTRHLARNGGPIGIRCNAVAPGIIDTEMIKGMNIPTDAIPLKRTGTVDDVAGPIYFLCSADARYMTGTVLNVTGGMVLAD